MDILPLIVVEMGHFDNTRSSPYYFVIRIIVLRLAHLDFFDVFETLVQRGCVIRDGRSVHTTHNNCFILSYTLPSGPPFSYVFRFVNNHKVIIIMIKGHLLETFYNTSQGFVVDYVTDRLFFTSCL